METLIRTGIKGNKSLRFKTGSQSAYPFNDRKGRYILLAK